MDILQNDLNLSLFYLFFPYFCIMKSVQLLSSGAEGGKKFEALEVNYGLLNPLAAGAYSECQAGYGRFLARSVKHKFAPLPCVFLP